MKKKLKPEESLLQKAEGILKQQPNLTSVHSEAGVLKLIHELEVHQIELEFHNHELMLAKEQLTAVLNQHNTLYDFASFGYFALSRTGKITKLNLSGARMLGKERLLLMNKQFLSFVSADTLNVFNLFLDKIFNSYAEESCEVTISGNIDLPRYVLLTGIIVENSDECLVTGIDITSGKQAEAELVLANKELEFRNKEKQKHAEELVIANKELEFQNKEKQKRAEELVLANMKLDFQNKEKRKRAEDLMIANKELEFQNKEKQKHAEYLTIANKNLLLVKEALHEENDFLENLIKYANAPIIIWDPQFRIIRFNQAFELLTGYRECDILGQSIDILFSPAIDKSSMPLIRKTLSNDSFETIEIKVLARDKSIRTLLWNSAPIFKPGKKIPIANVGLGQDITDRKKIEASLGQSEERFRSLIEHTPYAVVLHRNLKIIYVNQAAIRIFRAKSEQDLLGSSIMDRIHPDFHQIVQNRIRTGLDEGVSAPLMEVRYSRLDGTILDAEVQGAPIIYDGVPCIYAAINEITDYKRIQKLVQQNEARYGSMISNISDVIGIVGADGLMKYKSPNIEKHFGWLPEERVGTPAFSTIHPDDLELAEKVFSSLMENENTKLTFEFRYLCKDASYKPVEISAVNLITDPLINGILINYRDISERKQAEIAILDNAKKWETIIEASPDGVGLLSPDGRIEFASDKYMLLHGYTLEEKSQYLGKSVLDFIDPSEHQLLTDNMCKLFSGTQESSISEYIGIKKDQSRFNLSSNSAILFDHDGKPANILTMSRDITEYKQEEVARQKSKELYHKLLQTVPDMIIMTDIEGNITFANDKVVSFLDNGPKANIYGKNMFAFIAEHDLPRAIENTKLMFKSSLGAIEYQLKFDDKIIIDAEINGEIIRDSENNPSGFVFVIRNITDRKRTEDEKLISDSKILTLSMAIEQSPVTIVITDIAGTIEFVNPKFV